VVLEDLGANLTTDDPLTGDRSGIEAAKVLELIGPLFADPAARVRLAPH
jgi:hypothetical protein